MKLNYAHRSFETYGGHFLVGRPAHIHRKGKEKYMKTNKIDVQLISRELKGNVLDCIHVPVVEREQLHSLLEEETIWLRGTGA